MLRDSKTAQHGQGWLISFAVLLLAAAIAVVAYTVIQSKKNTEPTPEPVAQESFHLSDPELENLASRLVNEHLTNQNPELTEHQQALSNSLNHLSKHPNPQAQQVIELLNSGDPDNCF